MTATVRSNTVQVSEAVVGAGTSQSVCLSIQCDVGTCASTQGAERIKHSVVPERRRVVTTQTDGTEGASQIDRAATVEYQTTIVGGGVVGKGAGGSHSCTSCC
jgi:hypothetical protein